MQKYVKDLSAGDRTKWYTIISVNLQLDKVVACVQFNDGGKERRVWDDPLTPIEITNSK